MANIESMAQRPDETQKRRKRLENFPEEHEVVALLDAAKGSERDYMFLYLSANLGTRRGETIALTRESMRYLDQGYVMVNRLKQKEKVIDKIAVAGPIRDRIKWYMTRIPTGQKWFFPSRNRSMKDRHMTCAAANDIFLKYKAIAGIRDNLTLHSLRHFKGWKVWMATKNIKAVQGFLGHRSEKSSWIYTHCPFEEQREIADKLGEVK